MEKIRVMLVDDEERFLATTSKLLTRKGYEVVAAASGAEALLAVEDGAEEVVGVEVALHDHVGLAA